jgi:hypothetical protein
MLASVLILYCCGRGALDPIAQHTNTFDLNLHNIARLHGFC